MPLEKIISTNAFEAYRNNTGFIIEENKSAYLKMSLLFFSIGIVCACFSYVVDDVPFRKMLITVLTNGLFYGGLIAIFGSLIYFLLSFNLVRPKTIQFNQAERVLYFGRRKIPFDTISGFSCDIHKLFGWSIAKIKIKEKSIGTLFIIPPVIFKDNSVDIDHFVDELNQLILV